MVKHALINLTHSQRLWEELIELPIKAKHTRACVFISTVMKEKKCICLIMHLWKSQTNILRETSAFFCGEHNHR